MHIVYKWPHVVANDIIKCRMSNILNKSGTISASKDGEAGRRCDGSVRWEKGHFHFGVFNFRHLGYFPLFEKSRANKSRIESY